MKKPSTRLKHIHNTIEPLLLLSGVAALQNEATLQVLELECMIRPGEHFHLAFEKPVNEHHKAYVVPTLIYVH
jgi:hypothetical protein